MEGGRETAGVNSLMGQVLEIVSDRLSSPERHRPRHTQSVNRIALATPGWKSPTPAQSSQLANILPCRRPRPSSSLRHL